MSRLVLLLLLFFTISFASGCRKQDEIRAYDVENIDNSPKATPATKPISHQMLAAIVPVGQQAWFFKISGPPKAVNRQKGKLLELIGSLTPNEQNTQLAWKLPKGWTQESGSGKMGALFTIRFDNDDELVLAVSQLKIFGNSWDEYLLMNINRWRRQVGMQNISIGELSKKESDENDNIQMTTLENKTKIVLVNFLGKKQSGGGMRPPFAHMPTKPKATPKRPTPPLASSSLKYTVPKGWSQGRLSSMRKAAFEVKNKEDKKVEVTVSTAGGELLANVNMWHQQVQLKPIGKDDLKKLMKPMTINGHEGLFTELIGKSGKTIFIALVTVNDVQWFFKLAGDSKLAAQEKERFLTFVKSVTF